MRRRWLFGSTQRLYYGFRHRKPVTANLSPKRAPEDFAELFL